MVDQEVRHYAKVLEACVRIKGLTSREVDRRTGQGEGTFKRIFNGVIDLKVRHIFMVLEAIGMPEEYFFRLVGSTRSTREDGAGLFTALAKSGAPPRVETAAASELPPLTLDELERQIEVAIDRVMTRRDAAERKRGKVAKDAGAAAPGADGTEES
ncbi:MAG TPA: hypothetical protein VGE98_11980 [Thermoanaerobaculia bacterium]